MFESSEGTAQRGSKGVRFRYDIVVVTLEHAGKVLPGAFLDSKGMGADSVSHPGFDSLAHIVDAVFTLVAIIVTGSPVGEEEDDLSLCRLADEMFLSMAQGGADAGVSLRFDCAEPSPADLPRFGKVLDEVEIAPAARVRAESGNGKTFDKFIYNFTGAK